MNDTHTENGNFSNIFDDLWGKFCQHAGRILTWASAGKLLISSVGGFLSLNIILIYYSANKGVPYFEIINTVGGGIAVVSIIFSFYVFLMALIFLFPGVIRASDPTNKFSPISMSSDNEAQEKWNGERWIFCFGFGIIAYMGINIIILWSNFELLENLLPFISSVVVIIFICVRIVCILHKRNVRPSLVRMALRTNNPRDKIHLDFLIISNFFSMGFLYISTLMVFGIFNAIVNDSVLSDGSSFNTYVIYCMWAVTPMVPAVLVYVLSIWANEWSINKFITAFAGVIFFMLMAFPGAVRFIDIAFSQLMIGGNIEIVLYLDNKIGCSNPEFVIDSTVCKASKSEDTFMRSKSFRLLFLSEGKIYVKYKNTGHNSNNKTESIVIAIDREQVSAIEYVQQK